MAVDPVRDHKGSIRRETHRPAFSHSLFFTHGARLLPMPEGGVFRRGGSDERGAYIADAGDPRPGDYSGQRLGRRAGRAGIAKADPGGSGGGSTQAEPIRGWEKGKGWGWIWGKDDQVGALNALSNPSR